MRLPRKAVLVRLAIYLPLLGFFGWRAFMHWRAEQAATTAASDGESPEPGELQLPPPTKTIDVDGKAVQVYELTPAEAEAYFGVPQAPPETTTKPPAGEGKAPTEWP